MGISKSDATKKDADGRSRTSRSWRDLVPEYCSADHLSVRLGFHTHSIYRLAKTDPSFPKPIRIGGRLRFLIAEVDAYLERCRQEAAS